MRFRSPWQRRVAAPSVPLAPDPIVPGAGPDFLCIGAQKAGTTWLYEQLASHPDFWMPPRKELHYLNERGHAPIKTRLRRRDERDTRFLEKFEMLGRLSWLDLEGYGQLFAAKGSLLSGDITPAYCMLPDEIIHMVMRQFPKLKVVFFARDPVERAWSQLSLGVQTGGLAPFDETQSREVLRQIRHPLVLMRSYPSMIAERWRRRVPTEQFRVFFFDDLRNDPIGLHRTIVTFLGGDPEKSNSQLRPEQSRGVTEEKLHLTDEVRAHLARFFADELKACATSLGGAARGWPLRYGL
ncbi:MAG: sulfotransferase family protein [Chthoniobacterales bacterium]